MILRTTLIIFNLLFSYIAFTQCKVDKSNPINGEFSINGTKIQVKGDGNGDNLSPNNTPIKICEGEVIKLKSTLSVTSIDNVFYWILPLDTYNALSEPPKSTLSTSGTYTNIDGEYNVRMSAKTGTNPDGFSFYSAPGLYVITQYDMSTTSSEKGVHHACQVIEVIKPVMPVATAKSCTLGEYEIELLKHPNNVYDDYEITYNALAGNFNPIQTTGKPTSYPFSVKSPNFLNDTQDRIITIKGLTVTGGCVAPINNLGKISINTAESPTIRGVIATNQTNEFKLITNTKNISNANIFIREPQKEVEYDYNKILTTSKTKGNYLNDTITVNVPDENIQYCFQAATKDLTCPANTEKAYLKSIQEVCTTPIKVEAVKNKNIITWSKAPNGKLAGEFKYYEITRIKSQNSSENRFFQITNIDSLRMVDTTVSCNNIYTYQVLTYNTQTSYSREVKVKSSGSYPPSAIPQIFVTVLDDNKKIYLQGGYGSQNKPDDMLPNNFKFYRSDSYTGSYSLQNIGNTVFIDSTSEIEKRSLCYYMTWTNLCNNESFPSEKVCSIYLKNNNNNENLRWTSEKSHSIPTDRYLVQEVDKNGYNIKVWQDKEANGQFFNLGDVPMDYGDEKFFRIEALPKGWNVINANSLPSTLSNIVRVYKKPLANESEVSQSLKVYPIPTQDFITLELQTDKLGKLHWTLNNVVGNMLRQGFVNENKNNHQVQIDLRSLSKGIYFLRLEVGEEFFVRKIVKE